MVLWRLSPLLLLAGITLVGACSRTSSPAPDQARMDPIVVRAARPTAGPRLDLDAIPAEGRQSVLLRGVPHVRQRPDFCGEAAAEMWLSSLGKPVDQNQVFALSGMPPERGMGATTRELKTALERLGFQVGPVWNYVRTAHAAEDLSARFAELHADLVRGVPSIVCMHYDDRPHTTEHFRLVLGFDAERDEVVYHEPAVDAGAYLRMPRTRFLSLWPLKYERKRWTVIRLRLDGKDIHVPKPSDGIAPAELAQHVRNLRPTLPAGYTVAVEPPFVVIGNDTPERVRHRAQGTVKWTVERLKRDFFTRDPSRVLDVWLLKDAPSYQRLVMERFGSAPSTPYGFYSSERDALVMNIATGGGTLVHEIVHPFMESNFPACPAWFNEGLGSLFEQSADYHGHILGLTNWRLAGLQRAIRAGTVPPFEWLTATSSAQFYGEGSGLHYAQARYLLYYLQEQELLVRYYREFHRDHERDPTGYRTLMRLLGNPDPAEFQRKWQRYVLELEFDG